MIKKTLLFTVGLLLIVIIAAYFLYASPMLQVLNGYAAKKACTCHYVAHKEIDDIMSQDLYLSPLDMAQLSIDTSTQSMSSSVFGLSRRRAEYRGKLGCVLIKDKVDSYIPYRYKSEAIAYTEYPIRDRDSIQYNMAKIQTAFDYAFQAEFVTEGAMVIYQDSVIHEQYASNITNETPLLGWSMTKSITNALIGLLVKDGTLSLEDDHLFPQWTDERSRITLHHLLQMQSGIQWDEIYDQVSDATDMLYNSDDMLARIISNPLESDPGTHWEYSSGTTNLLIGLIRSKFKSNEAFYDFVFHFFNKAGMSTAFIEPDESGNLIGSSYGYASVRDWARFGQLYLHQGYINDRQLLDTAWVQYSARPISKEVCQYGAHFWTNGQQCEFPTLPSDLYYASGFNGQYVFIIPSLDLIVVRLGNSTTFDQEKFVREVISGLET